MMMMMMHKKEPQGAKEFLRVDEATSLMIN
jgi:hypothetical protein